MRVRLLLSGSALAIGVMTGPALAQETPAPGSDAAAARPDDNQGEIIITARRRDELWELLLFHAWETICCYPLTRRRRVAGGDWRQ